MSLGYCVSYLRGRTLPIALSLVCAAVLLATTALISQAAPTVPDELAFTADIVYAKNGGEEQKLDLARPKQGTGPFPAMVFVHGGGWRGGSKADYHQAMFGVAKLGVVCISIDYRLLPKHPFPAAVQDTKCAIRWLRAHAEEYHIDPARIGAMGGSAGAHLLALAGTTHNDQKWDDVGEHQDQSSGLQAIICHGGPYDLAVGYRNTVQQNEGAGALVRGLLEDFLGGKPEAAEKTYREASPIHFVDAASPPFLLLHGIDDPLVPIEQADLFYAKLKAEQVPADINRIEKGGHGGFGEEPHKVLTQAVEFLKKHLKM